MRSHKRLGDNSNVATLTFLVTSALPTCPDCHSDSVVKNGFIHNGKQNHLCKDCGRQFVKDPQNKVISDETKALIDKLLLEKIPLAGMARVADVSEVWLQGYVNKKYASVPREVNVRAITGAIDLPMR